MSEDTAGGSRSERGAQSPSSLQRARRAGPIGVGVVMVLCGILLATSARISGGESIRDDSGDVITVLQERDRAITELTGTIADQRAQIEELTTVGTDIDTEQRSTLMADAVGLSAVSGPAVRITLSDAPQDSLGIDDDVTADDLVVHQQDMEAFINALWAGGAEAMMLQDQRVVAGSAFRCAGNTLLLEGRVYSPPFVITAIGPTEQMLESVDSAPGVQVYRQWVDHVGLGERSETLEQTTLPAFDGSLTIDTAKAG